MTTEFRLDQLVEDPDNIRTSYDADKLQELADSIASFGLITNLSVVLNAEGQPVIKAGHRRYRAMMLNVAAKKMKATDTVPCDVWEPTSEAFSTTLMLIENLQREDITPLDEAGGYMRLAQQFGMKQKEIATQVGKSQGHVSKRLALLTLPDKVRDQLAAGKLSLDLAYDLAALPADHPKVEKLLKQAAKDPSRIQSYEVDEAKRAVDRAKRADAFGKELEARMLEVYDGRPDSTKNGEWNVMYITGTDELKAYVPAKGDILCRQNFNFVDQLTLYRKRTAAEIKARQKAEEKQAAENEAALTPYDRWEAETNRLEEEHDELVWQVKAQQAKRYAELVLAMSNKDLLRATTEMVQAALFSGYEAVRVLDALGINYVPTDTEKRIFDYERAQLALPVLNRWLAEDPAMRTLQAHQIVNPVAPTAKRLLAEVAEQYPEPKLELPPEPWQQEDGVWTTDPRPQEPGEKDGDTIESDIADAVAETIAAMDHDPSEDELAAIEATIREQFMADAVAA